MDDLVQSLLWIAPLLFGVLGWLATRYRESDWGKKLAERIGTGRREHEQEWEYQRRIGSLWLSISAVFGVLTYLLVQRVVQDRSNVETWEVVALVVCAIVFISTVSNSVKSFWASRRDP